MNYIGVSKKKEKVIFVQTPQKILHKLKKEATIYSEMDMGCGFHQLALGEKSKNKSVFQTHEGLYKIERLCLVLQLLVAYSIVTLENHLLSLRGVTNIDDNILVYRKNCKDYYDNSESDRCTTLGIVLKLPKSTFGMAGIKYFDSNFHYNGVSADPLKTANVKQAG